MKLSLVRSGLSLVWLMACLAGAAQPATTPAPQADMAAIMHPDSCRFIVETLAADSFMGRYAGSPQATRAAMFIAKELEKAGCKPVPRTDSFLIPFRFMTPKGNHQCYNVVGVIPGKAKAGELVLFSAHYDHVGTLSTNDYRSFMREKGKPEKGDTIYNGANDNASGISALIALARYFAKTGPHERTLVFIAFSAEEEGLHGSKALSLRMDLESVVAMINMDMVGVPMSATNRNPIITGGSLSDLQKILNDRLYEAAPQYGKYFFRKDNFPTEGLFTRSDNYPFAVKGVPAHTIMASSPRNRYYHSLNDEPGTIDYHLIAHIARAIALASRGLADGSDTPSRINKNLMR
jgi:Zn-dependent M28 family amino/carboxypeptidase